HSAIMNFGADPGTSSSARWKCGRASAYFFSSYAFLPDLKASFASSSSDNAGLAVGGGAGFATGGGAGFGTGVGAGFASGAGLAAGGGAGLATGAGGLAATGAGF